MLISLETSYRVAVYGTTLDTTIYPVQIQPNSIAIGEPIRARGPLRTTSDSVHQRMFVGNFHGGTLVYRRSLWQQGVRYPAVNLAEDAMFIRRASQMRKKIARLDNPGTFIYVRRGRNSWKFECRGVPRSLRVAAGERSARIRAGARLCLSRRRSEGGGPVTAAPLVAGVLAAWRLTHLITAEDGPLRVFARLRAVMRGVGGLLDCFYCTSVWLSVPLAWALGESLRDRAVLVLALSGGAVLAERATTRSESATKVAYWEEPEIDHELLRKKHEQDDAGESELP